MSDDERLNVTRHNGDYTPPWVGDEDAEDGRSIVENDAIQAEHAPVLKSPSEGPST